MQSPVLIVEDDKLQQQMLSTLLRRKMGYASHCVENGRDALDVLSKNQNNAIKLVILDLTLPIMGGMETLEIIKKKHSNMPVIMLTGSRDVKHVVQAMRLGATDFVTKPYDADRMMITVKNALKLSILSQEVSRLKSEKKGHLSFPNLIGHDQGLLQVISDARKASASDIPVLITGETGTGKEVFAQAIHGESVRAGAPFIAINCGAIPAQLVESTLFGHEKGAFTGATEQYMGKFREADGGTIFLDEVGELPLETQVKLLRVLQQKEVEAVGRSEAIPVNVRIISATNRNLDKDIADGKFREDLFYRLNVLHLDLPTLKDRKKDIHAFAEHFIERFCVSHNVLPKVLTRESIQTLCAYNWPGNVRQLENVINRAMVMSEGSTIEATEFAPLLSDNDTIESFTPTPSTQEQANTTINLLNDKGEVKNSKDLESEIIQKTLKHFDNNITQSADALGMARSTFYTKIKT